MWRGEKEFFTRTCNVRDLSTQGHVDDATGSGNSQSSTGEGLRHTELLQYDGVADSLHRMFSEDTLNSVTNVSDRNQLEKVWRVETSSQDSIEQDSMQCLHVDRQELIKLQKSDDTLQGIKGRIVPECELHKHRVCFYEKDNLLMRQWEKKSLTKKQGAKAIHPDIVHQVVLPEKCRL